MIRKESLLSVVFVLLFTNCNKEPYIDEESLTGSWILTSLVNVSDEYKYLNKVLEINGDSTYSNGEISGSVIVSGNYFMFGNSDSINLSKGIFEGYSVNYKILKCENDELVLNRRYTLAEKDTTMQYYYKRYDQELQ